MGTQRLGKSKFHIGESCVQSIPRCRKIATNVNAGGKKVRQQHDAPGPRRNAARCPFVNVGLGQFQKGSDHRHILTASSQLGG
jgi:hypothetical protein